MPVLYNMTSWFAAFSFQGGDKVDLPYADASDGQVTSTEATPCKDDSECDQEENASRVSEPIPGYHCLSKCSRLLEYRESEREWNPRPSRGNMTVFVEFICYSL